MSENAGAEFDGEKWITHWDHVRRVRLSSSEPPEDWPKGVRGISLEGLSLIGIDERTNELYWDGQKLVTERRFSTFERVLAVFALTIAAIGAAATVVQAWAALAALP